MDAKPRASPKPSIGLRPPQFRLRTLLLALAVLAVLFAALQWVSFAVWVGLVFFGLSLALHVAANALGTQLRQNHGGEHRSSRIVREADAEPQEVLPPSHLSLKTELARPIFWISLGTGLLAAGVACYWTAIYRERSGWESYVVAVVAFGVLGSIWMFLSLSFLHITFRAAWHAIGQHSAEEKKRTSVTNEARPPANHTD